MYRQTDQHCLVLDVLLVIEPGLRSPPPDVAAHPRTGDGHSLPRPQRDEDGPPGAVQDPVQLERVEQREQQQGGEHHELASVELLK